MSGVQLRTRGADADYRCDCGSLTFRKDSETHFTCVKCSAGFTATPLNPAANYEAPRQPPALPEAPPQIMVCVPLEVLDYVLGEAQSVDHSPHEERQKVFAVVYAAMDRARGLS